jgi:hypothetical protein
LLEGAADLSTPLSGLIGVPHLKSSQELQRNAKLILKVRGVAPQTLRTFIGHCRNPVILSWAKDDGVHAHRLRFGHAGDRSSESIAQKKIQVLGLKDSSEPSQDLLPDVSGIGILRKVPFNSAQPEMVLTIGHCSSGEIANSFGRCGS